MLISDIDFLIIGAAKSATTWLQRALQADPEVAMPDPEPHYFSREHHRGDDWYLALFPQQANAAVIGEKSNSYLESTEAADRIAAVLPNVKLVAQLRNPVERAYSDYCMMYRRGEVGRDVGYYLDPRNVDKTRLISAGYYSRQLEAYYERFPATNIHVAFFEAVMQAPEKQLADVRRFLGLPLTESPDVIRLKAKDKTTPMLQPGLRRILRPLKPVVAPLRRTSLFRKAHATLAREIAYSPFPQEARARLMEHYEREVEALGRLVGRDLSGWLHQSALPESRMEG